MLFKTLQESDKQEKMSHTYIKRIISYFKAFTKPVYKPKIRQPIVERDVSLINHYFHLIHIVKI